MGKQLLIILVWMLCSIGIYSQTYTITDKGAILLNNKKVFSVVSSQNDTISTSTEYTILDVNDHPIFKKTLQPFNQLIFLDDNRSFIPVNFPHSQKGIADFLIKDTLINYTRYNKDQRYKLIHKYYGVCYDENGNEVGFSKRNKKAKLELYGSYVLQDGFIVGEYIKLAEDANGGLYYEAYSKTNVLIAKIWVLSPDNQNNVVIEIETSVDKFFLERKASIHNYKEGFWFLAKQEHFKIIE